AFLEATMDVFELRNRLVGDYASYTRSFIKIADPRIRAKVDSDLEAGAFWPEPLLQLNPTFKPGGTIDDLVSDGTLHHECAVIFRIERTETDHTGKPLVLHTHQTEAIRKAKEEKSYVLTSGTGSGKSLTYIVPIVDHVLRRGSGKGIQAIVVYPMNALANSQHEELSKFSRKRLRGRKVSCPLCSFHWPGEGSRARGDPQQSAGHSADQLHDVGVAAYPQGGPRAGPSGARFAVSGSRRTTHLSRAAGRRRGAANPSLPSCLWRP